MSRSGYSCDLQNWDLIRWRGAVKSAIRGERGQAALRELLAALDAMPEKRLIADELQAESGEVCTLGCLGVARGLDMSRVDYDDPEEVGKFFGIARAMAAEIEFLNDESRRICETPEQRWQRMRDWVAEQIREEVPA